MACDVQLAGMQNARGNVRKGMSWEKRPYTIDITISATLVNTQAHTHAQTAFDWLYCKLSQLSYKCIIQRVGQKNWTIFKSV